MTVVKLPSRNSTLQYSGIKQYLVIRATWNHGEASWMSLEKKRLTGNVIILGDSVPLARDKRDASTSRRETAARVEQGKREARTRKITARSQSIDSRRLLFVYGPAIRFNYDSPESSRHRKNRLYLSSPPRPRDAAKILLNCILTPACLPTLLSLTKICLHSVNVINSFTWNSYETWNKNLSFKIQFFYVSYDGRFTTFTSIDHSVNRFQSKHPFRRFLFHGCTRQDSLVNTFIG